MTGYEKYKYWLQLAEYDIETAKVLLDAKRFIYVAVLCQKAIERMLKGMFICHTGKETPKSHNIPFLANKLSLHKKFSIKPEGQRFSDEKEKYEDTLVDLMFYYMDDYPFSYKNFSQRFIKESSAVEIYEKTLELMDWLKSFQTEPM